MDLSYHPVDEKLVVEALVAGALGRKPDPMPVAVRMRRIARARQIAAAYAFAIQQALDAPVEPSAEERRSFWKRLLGLGRKRSLPPPRTQPNAPFEPFLHIWGRPFLVASDAVEDAIGLVRRYVEVSANEADVERLARAEASVFVSDVLPDIESREPEDVTDEDIARRVEANLTSLADSLAAGNAASFQDLFLGHASRMLQACLPYWQDRGLEFRSAALAAVGADIEDLTRPFVAGFPELAVATGAETAATGCGRPAPAFEGPEWIGAYVPSEKVPVLLERIRTNAGAVRDRLVQTEELLPDDAGLSVRKLTEAVAYASATGGGFLEVSGVSHPAEGDVP